jgi:hypothetical protein
MWTATASRKDCGDFTGARQRARRQDGVRILVFHIEDPARCMANGGGGRFAAHRSQFADYGFWARAAGYSLASREGIHVLTQPDGKWTS